MADVLPRSIMSDAMRKSPVATTTNTTSVSPAAVQPGLVDGLRNGTGTNTATITNNNNNNNVKEGSPRIPLTGREDNNVPNNKLSSSQSKSPTQVVRPPGEQQAQESQTAIDPLSRHILKRTNTENMIPQKLRTGGSNDADPGASESGQSASRVSSSQPSGALRREDTTRSSKDGKDRRNRVSFLSRFIGGKKKDPLPDFHDDASEIFDNRTEGMDATVFSQPIGFIPRFPAPPKYIKVRIHNCKEKDFDRVFLAQDLHGKRPPRKKESKLPSTTLSEGANVLSRTGSAIWALEFSKDGRYLAAAGQDKIVRIWGVLASPDDRLAHESEEEAKDGDEPAVRLNAPVFKTRPIREFDGHTASVLDLSWSKNNFLLSSSMDKTVRLWHVSRNECLCCFKHSDFVTSIQFHPRDDRFFLAGSLDSKLRLWSIPDKSVAFWTHVPDMVTAVTFTPDGKTSVAGCLNGLCMFYETEGLKPYTQIHVKSARGRNAKGSKITGMDTITLPPNDPNGEVKLLITSNDSRVRLYNFRDRNLEIKFRGNENTCSQIHATFSDDGRYVICGSEDRRAYIWPIVNVEPGKEQDKRPVEVFEAHSAIVTTAILAPTKTRQLLGLSGDPIYDLCNPPPVTLVDRSGSLPSSKPPSVVPGDAAAVSQTPRSQTQESVRNSKAEESPAYIARSSHINGNIIISADYTGSIKVFRQDCAHQKRRHESWDSNPMTKKLLGRSGSVATRTSVGSTSRRNSINKHNPSADRILSWRNSIASSNHGSLDSLRNNGQRPRSVSPHKSLSQMSHQSSPRHGGTPLATNTTPSITTTSSPPSVVSQTTIEPPHASPRGQSGSENVSNKTPSEAPQYYKGLPLPKEDPLMLQGEQSYMFWNRANFSAQAATQARTPGLLEPDSFMGGPVNRKESVISQLSSEVESTEGEGSEGDEEALKCPRCGGTSFRAKKKDGRQTLICNRCGTAAL